MIDFSEYERTRTLFGGSERKVGLNINDFEYMIKFPKKTAFGKRNNHISEYLGSHIYGLLGYNVQETHLGVYSGEEVVACKNFILDGEEFVPFNDVGESSLERNKEVYQYSYEDIMQMLHDNVKLTDVQETVSIFWEMYVVDALIGNFDRHGGNWGFIKRGNKYSIAPIFDNGSSLYPNLTDEGMMKKIMDSEELTNERIYKFPTSQVKLNGEKSSYPQVISSMRYSECNDAVIKVCRRYNGEEVDKLIDTTEFIDETQKRFYKYMLRQRLEKILLPTYKELEK